MVNRTFQFAFNDLKLTVPQIESVMGYKEGEERELVTDLIEEILRESQEICTVKAQYTIFPGIRFDNDSKSVVIDNINFLIKKIVFSQIKKSDSAAIFLCTAGAEIGIRSRRAMQEKDLLRGYIYDVVGSEIVEAAADLMQIELEKEVISTHRKITNRYSPGYCGWDVAEQHKLFQLVPDNFCGIRLTESALMDPVKSVSGIIGIGDNVRFNPYTCGMCDLKDCLYRKHGH
ncbi:MAG: vitamin B12 dependent-methionine synthase activation domain-containing protein [Bacteroidota bacterium]